MKPSFRRLLSVLWAVATLSGPAGAHDGPPYPVLVDESIAGWTVSVWADPDVGEGTFYYYVDAPLGRSPSDLCIEVIAQRSDPSSSQAPSVARGESQRAPARTPYQQVGRVIFTERGSWNTRFVLRDGDANDPPIGELACELDVTPPGLGPIELTWYAIPFIICVGLWLRMFLAQRRYDRAQSATTSTNP